MCLNAAVRNQVCGKEHKTAFCGDSLVQSAVKIYLFSNEDPAFLCTIYTCYRFSQIPVSRSKVILLKELNSSWFRCVNLNMISVTVCRNSATHNNS